jgi:bifunctional non-homologous end joining protein LigD
MPSKPPRSIHRQSGPAMPDFIDPQLATLSVETPSGSQWVHEVKFDGYRAQVRVEKGRATINTRRGKLFANSRVRRQKPRKARPI